MKKLFIFAVIVLASCAGNNEVEKALKGYVVEKMGKDVKYNLVSYDIRDTMKVSDRLNMLSIEILENGNLCSDMTKDSLLKIKETVFPDYLLKGETLNIINKHKQSIDSIASNWDEGTPYSFALNFEEIWFYSLYVRASGMDISEYENKMDWMQDNRALYDETESLKKRNANEVFGYRIEHDYTIFNPLLKKDIEFKNIVILDKDLQHISSENANSAEDMLKQITQ